MIVIILVIAFLATLRGGVCGPDPNAQWPGWDPKPKKGELPITSGSIVNMQSLVLGTFCNVGPDSVLRCDQADPSPVSSALLIIGNDYSTNKLYDGSSIMLKSQKANKLCGVGAKADGAPIVCGAYFAGPTTELIITRARLHPGQNREDDVNEKHYYSIAPAAHPSHKCHPPDR